MAVIVVPVVAGVVVPVPFAAVAALVPVGEITPSVHGRTPASRETKNVLCLSEMRRLWPCYAVQRVDETVSGEQKLDRVEHDPSVVVVLLVALRLVDRRSPSSSPDYV